MGLAFNPGQQKGSKLLAGPQRHTCLVGGSRSGKTTLLVDAVIIRAGSAANSRHLIVRKNINAVRASIAMDTLPKVVRLKYPHLKVVENKTPDYYFTLPNDSQIWVGGLDDKDRVDKILGREYATILFNECSQIAYASVLTALTRLAQVVTRDGSNEVLTQRAYYDLNPVGKGHWTNVQFGDKKDPLTRQPLADPENYARLFLNPKDNLQNLTPEYIKSLENLPERQRKRFFDGVYIDEQEGALWTYESIEVGRVTEADILPDRRRRVVVAVDPSGAKSEQDESRDEIGIVVAALGIDGHGYVLADRSLRDSPIVWARQVIRAYHEFGADSIVAEENFGGAMVQAVIRAADPNVPVKLVRASKSKVVRAEPVAALYGDPPEFKNCRVHHVGRHPRLEDQMVATTTVAYTGEGSPDKLDALVWAITELMLTTSAEAWIAYVAKMAEDQQAEIAGAKTARPVVKDAPTLDDIDNSVAESYKRVTRRLTNKPTLCAWCDKPVGPSRIMDGVDAYHNDQSGLDCYRSMLKKGKRAEVAAEV